VPNLIVLRPADASETAVAWKIAVEHEGGPVALVLTRQKLGFIDRTAPGVGAADGVAKGAYVLEDAAGGKPKVILMASGSEVALTLKAKAKLAEQGVQARVVSMASMEIFAQQPESYQASVLPAGVPRVAIEAGHPMSWYKWIAGNGEVLGLTRYGASAPYEKIYEELGLTVERLVAAAKSAIAK
jgi:transketolase